jgi:signal transduction histidine kinase
MAHELGTPMNVISVRAELIIEEAASAQSVSSARVIKSQIDKMTGIIRQLLEFARRRLPRKDRTDLVQLVEQATQLLGPLARNKQIEIKFSSASGPLWTEVDPGQIQQLLSNLLLNSIQAMPNGGNIEVHVGQELDGQPTEEQAAGDGASRRRCARIDVQDEGTGISPDHLHRIFDPFFTTKEVGEGTGLGLSIAYGIVKDHDGRIDVQSTKDQGSQFSIFLPLDADAVSPAQLSPTPNLAKS